ASGRNRDRTGQSRGRRRLRRYRICGADRHRGRRRGSTTPMSEHGFPMATTGPDTALEQVLYQVKRVIVGQDVLLERMVIALLARGHLLVEGVPGLAKTLAVKTLADAVGGEFQRIQFTPDLVPA